MTGAGAGGVFLVGGFVVCRSAASAGPQTNASASAAAEAFKYDFMKLIPPGVFRFAPVTLRLLSASGPVNFLT
jgi:hypothetical protein